MDTQQYRRKLEEGLQLFIIKVQNLQINQQRINIVKILHNIFYALTTESYDKHKFYEDLFIYAWDKFQNNKERDKNNKEHGNEVWGITNQLRKGEDKNHGRGRTLATLALQNGELRIVQHILNNGKLNQKVCCPTNSKKKPALYFFKPGQQYGQGLRHTSFFELLINKLPSKTPTEDNKKEIVNLMQRFIYKAVMELPQSEFKENIINNEQLFDSEKLSVISDIYAKVLAEIKQKISRTELLTPDQMSNFKSFCSCLQSRSNQQHNRPTTLTGYQMRQQKPLFGPPTNGQEQPSCSTIRYWTNNPYSKEEEEGYPYGQNPSLPSNCFAPEEPPKDQDVEMVDQEENNNTTKNTGQGEFAGDIPAKMRFKRQYGNGNGNGNGNEMNV